MCDSCVVTDEMDSDLAGLAGCTGKGEGDGAAPCDDGGRVSCGMLGCVGVCTGVEWPVGEAAVVLSEASAWRCCDGATYDVPSSPGANVKHEQKPSEEVMSSVRPSADHARSVKVA